MSDEAFDIEDEPELDEVDDEELDLDDDLALDDAAEVDDDGTDDDATAKDAAKGAEPSQASEKGASGRREGDEDEDVMELDEEHHPDDVEEPLDVLLHERTASASLEDEEEDEAVEEIEVDERGEGPTKIVPRRPGEFLCTSCFLVLPRTQLGDEQRMLCRDCV